MNRVENARPRHRWRCPPHPTPAASCRLPTAFLALCSYLFALEIRNSQSEVRNRPPALALAQIEWLGQIRFAEVIVKDDFIIGTELLKDARLVVDYPARTLTISREEKPNSR